MTLSLWITFFALSGAFVCGHALGRIVGYGQGYDNGYNNGVDAGIEIERDL